MSDEVEGRIIYHPAADPDGNFLVPSPRNPGRVRMRGPDRDAEAARMKAMGYTLTEICDELNLGTDTTRAAAAIRRALTVVTRFAHDEMRVMELISLDELEAHAWRMLRKAHYVVSNGRLVHDGDGEPLDDDRFVLETIDRILKIKERRARMMGLDAPARSEVLTIDSIDAEIARLEGDLMANKPLDQSTAASRAKIKQLEKEFDRTSSPPVSKE